MISIILPVYKTEKYIKDCINSILKQDYLNFEVIIVDDGSPDNSINIIKPLIKNDQRFKIYHKKNGGLSSARNFGISIASGEYIMFLDSDDCIQMNTLSIMINYIENNAASVCKCEFESFTDTYSYHSNKVSVSSLSKDEFFEKILTLKESLYSCGVLIPKNFFKNVKFPIGEYFEDMSTMYKIYNQADRIYIINSKLYKYRLNPNSIVHTINMNKVNDYISAINNFINFYKKNFNSTNSSINIFLCESYIECFKFTKDEKFVLMYKKTYNFLNTIKCNPKFFIKLLLFNYSRFFRLYLLKK